MSGAEITRRGKGWSWHEYFRINLEIEGICGVRFIGNGEGVKGENETKDGEGWRVNFLKTFIVAAKDA